MEYITSKVPAAPKEGEAGKVITSYLRAHKQELNHVLESIFMPLSARIKKIERAAEEGAFGGAFESGETDGWRWRKYRDGTAECFCRFECADVKCTESWGGMYISADYGGESFPFSFSEVPNVQYSISGTGARGYLLGYPSADGSAGAENTGKWWFARGSASSTADLVYVDVRAEGRLAE